MIGLILFVGHGGVQSEWALTGFVGDSAFSKKYHVCVLCVAALWLSDIGNNSLASGCSNVAMDKNHEGVQC